MLPIFNTKRTVTFIFWFILILFATLYIKAVPVNAQTLPPNIWMQVFEDDNGFYMLCQNECEAFNQLGTPEELTKHFQQMHCSVNWYYALHNRKYGQIELAYLVGPNGNTSNPLCLEFIE
jgi:hypothetical protein